VKAEEQRLEDKQEKKNDVWVATDAADAAPVYKTKRFVKQQRHKSLLDAFDRKVFGGTAR
jgi:cytochrome P450